MGDPRLGAHVRGGATVTIRTFVYVPVPDPETGALGKQDSRLPYITTVGHPCKLIRGRPRSNANKTGCNAGDAKDAEDDNDALQVNGKPCVLPFSASSALSALNEVRRGRLRR
jgi:hypothetical protein